MKNIFIFDLDDTLYQKDENTDQYINLVDTKLFDNLDGDKILFSNASYNHCMNHLELLKLKDKFQAIFSYDILRGYKPNPSVYHKISYLCNLSLLEHNIYFFDNLAINLVYAKKLGWHTYLILPESEDIILSYNEDINNHLNSKIDTFIDNRYDNINEAIKNLVELE